MSEADGRVCCYIWSWGIVLTDHRLGLTKTGQGARIEAIARSIPSLVVPGGSEDVLLDLGVREAVKLSKLAKESKL